MIIKPNLFIPGAAKSGTSALHDCLNQHPNIYMTTIKEPHFFSHNEKYYNKKDWYYSLFKGKSCYKIRGESSTGYMVFPNVIKRIKKDIKDPKFIFILRNPIDRIYSHYYWLKGFGYENLNFREAFLNDNDIEPNFKKDNPMGYKYYYQWGLYGKWINRFYDNFNSKNIFIITNEEFKNNFLNTLNRCFNFLEVKNLDKAECIISNKTLLLKNPNIYNFFKKILPSMLKIEQCLGLKNINSKIIGDKRRKKISFFINNLINKFVNINAKKGVYPPLKEQDRKYIAEFYLKDVDLLKKITKKHFNEWKDF